MPVEEFEIDFGPPLNSSTKLKITKAKATLRAIQKSNSFTLISTHSSKTKGIYYEHIKCEIHNDTPQVPKENILYKEPLAITFREDDKYFPEVTCLRKNFPTVPHLNLSSEGAPHSPCIYSESFAETQLTWTAEEYLRRIYLWFSKTSRGKLHQSNQPLEPFFHPGTWDLVIPFDFKENIKNPELNLIGRLIDRESGKTICLTFQNKEGLDKIKKANPGIRPIHTLSIEGNSTIHGIIKRTPTTVDQLNDALKCMGINLINELGEFIKTSYSKNICSLEDSIMILLKIPLKRAPQETIEVIHWRAFWIIEDINIFGSKILGFDLNKALKSHKGKNFAFETIGKTQIDTVDAPVQILKPITSVSRKSIPRLNGVPEKNNLKLGLIGVGALGSYLLNNFARLGFGSWTITDNDHLLPHNLARHILSNLYIGYYKSLGMWGYLNDLFPNEDFIKPFHHDFLIVEENQELLKEFEEADVIIDTSASIAVARKLSIETKIKRALSAFFTPSGENSVLITEDSKRKACLDSLEAQYYRWIIQSKFGGSHLVTNEAHLRYGGGCRDVSVQISIENIQLHSAILSKQIRNNLESHDSIILINISNQESSVIKTIDVPISPVKHASHSKWKIFYDAYVIQKAEDLRKRDLPKETGGAIVGYFDTSRKRVYIVDLLPKPPDSKLSEYFFVRGFKNLRKTLQKISKKTLNQVDFIGDWHSHTEGVSVNPSSDDKKLLNYHATEMGKAGLPGLILIVGDKNKLNWLIKEDV